MHATRRGAWLAAAILAAGLGAGAVAAPPSCNLLVDARGDATPVQDPRLDVLSADIVSDANRLTAVIRLAGSPYGIDPLSPLGRSYRIQFEVPGGKHPVFLAYVVTPYSASAAHGYYDERKGVYQRTGPATFEVRQSTAVLTVPLKTLAQYGSVTPGSKITNLAVETGRVLGSYLTWNIYAFSSPTADQATSTRSYVAGARSCIKVAPR